MIAPNTALKATSPACSDNIHTVPDSERIRHLDGVTFFYIGIFTSEFAQVAQRRQIIAFEMTQFATGQTF